MTQSKNEYYIWAAGTYGRRLVNFLRENAPEVNVIAFIDQDSRKKGTVYNGLPVIDWENAKLNVPRVKVIISMSLPTEPRDFLLREGFIEFEDFFTDLSFVPRYFWETKKQLVISNTVVLPTNRCPLNCDGCYAYVPYAKKKFVCDFESLKKNINELFKHIDKSINLNMSGGETLLNKAIPDFCVYLHDNLSDKYMTHNITTSGTILPTDEDMKKFAYAKTEFSISNYSEINETAREIHPQLLEKCDKFGVYHYLDRQCDHGLWFDLGNPYEINITDSIELSSRFNRCFKTTSSCLDGKLFACVMQHWRYVATGVSAPNDDDYFDLSNDVTEDSRERIMRVITRQPKLSYQLGCMNCGGTFTSYVEKTI